ncbi:MAG: STAS domain-containing protein [Opitutales bacterium]|nr:STAS domain-containing protein [Opitutales bacterium]
MPEDSPVFLVNPYADPVVVRINGRANYLNSSPMREFFAMIIAQGRKKISIDFRNCLAVDSTFLGIVAGAALELADQEPPGEMRLVALGPRNLELIRNLGLHRIVTLSDEIGDAESAAGMQELQNDSISKDDRVRMIIDAHKKLIKCDESNAERFQDVLAFMRKRSGWDPSKE